MARKQAAKDGIKAADQRLWPFGRQPQRSFGLAIALPALLLYFAGAALVAWALSTMAQEIDRAERMRDVTAIHAALDSFLAGLGDSVADEGTWNEAYLNVVVNSDPAWMDTTWGAAARLGTLYDTVVVTDATGAIVFGENDIGALKGDIGTLFPAARTMLATLDKGIGATGDATTVSNFASDSEGAAGLAAISIHQSNIGDMSVPRRLRRILWIGKHMTSSLLQQFATRYQTPLPALMPRERGGSSIDLADANGNLVGTLAWMPDRPGEAALGHAGLIAGAIYLAIGAALLFGLGRLHRAVLRRSRDLDAGIAAAMAAAAAPPVPVPDDEEAGLLVRADAPLPSAVAHLDAAAFSIEYQPVFDLRAEQLTGVEALLRWRGPEDTVIAQEQLGSADAQAMIQRVAVLAARHAAREIAPLLGLVLTTSVTPSQLESSVFSEKLIGTLAAMNLPAARLQLAVDATVLPAVARLRGALSALRRHGIGIALSNFTLGPANLDYLDRTLASRIRLAPSMVAGVDTHPLHFSLVEATLDAARVAGIDVGVPGVERREEAARLLRLGCREFQGNILARPMPLPALSNLVLAPPARAPVQQAS